MVRIDELYDNIFASALQHRSRVALHWFDPFGSTDFLDICNRPPIDGVAELRLLFWDQEPLQRDRITAFLDQFMPLYLGPTHVITSEHNSEQVCWMQNTYGVGTSYYFFHAWAALDWYRGYDRTFLAQPFAQRTIQHTILCPNNIVGGQRQHRLELLGELVKKNLIAGNLISFPAICPYEQRSVADLCHTHNIALGSVDLPLVIDHGTNHATHSHRINLWHAARHSLVHVVTETVFAGKRSHLTEKTFKPIVMQQPFVLVSCQGSLRYLRQYGFKTFGEFWNEDYDEHCDHTRIKRIATLLSDIHSLSATEQQQLQRHVAPVVEHNFKWFYSREFEQLLWKETTDMIGQW